MLKILNCLILFFIGIVLGKEIKFPDDFIFGTATAAYQVEGAYDAGDRGMTIWDTFSNIVGNVDNNDNGNVADDQYFKYLGDVKLMKELGIKAYRFSIAWSRILPTGQLPVNPKGLEYYNNLLDALEDANITPFVTLFHWDTPQFLENEYGAWLDRRIVEDFRTYAEICFENFGHRVKHWLTLNEPWSVAILGYGTGQNAPGRCSDRMKCGKGDTWREPYIAGHNLLLAHGAAVQTYRSKYQEQQGGVISLVMNMEYVEPVTPTSQNILAAEQRKEFQFSWFGDPVVFGDYPESMRRLIGDRLPQFTEEEKELLKGSCDFIGFNNYATYYVQFKDLSVKGSGYGWWDWWDSESICLTEKDGVPIGPIGDSNWLTVVPRGIRESINWVYQRYGLPIYVTENGCDVPNENELPLNEALQDDFRVSYLSHYIGNVSLAIQDGSDVKGYFVWSLLDNFEWHNGYTKRFGIIYIDYSDLSRHPKKSFYWYKEFISQNTNLLTLQMELSLRYDSHRGGIVPFYIVIALVAFFAAGILTIAIRKHAPNLRERMRILTHRYRGYTEMDQMTIKNRRCVQIDTFPIQIQEKTSKIDL